jgi:hypothetical protein
LNGESPTGTQEIATGLQADLNAALRTLSFARAEKSDSGCMATVTGLGSCFGGVVGLGLTSCGSGITVAGLVVLGFSIAGFIRSLTAGDLRPPSMDKAEAQIVDVASRLTGNEALGVDGFDRDNLHHLLKIAQPNVAIAVLKILACVGDHQSLKLMRITAEREGFADGIASCFDADVKHVAGWAANILEARMYGDCTAKRHALACR